MGEEEPNAPSDFIRKIVAADLASGKNGGRVVTRFPPEPNGYLHIGHAKAITLDFNVAAENEGVCHLRFDDTNPTAEESAFADAIKEDIRWLGFDWGEHEYFTSDYFEKLHGYAVELIRRGKAYVCDFSSEEIAANRGTLTQAGSPSPGRSRSVEENLELFARMKSGEFENGERTLRAKVDMGASNLTMRDPILYRVHKTTHHRSGDAWCIYPMYDFAHCLSDSIEGITHSFCTLEFVDHRAFYDWLLDALEVESHPQQIEFARLNLSHTVMSKRILRTLVEREVVDGWDDPRMPTISGMRRRGYPPRALRSFCEAVGVAKRDNLIELARLEASVREELNRTASRALAVLDPLKLVIENYPEGEGEVFDAANHPDDPSMGTRSVPFSRELYIERDDFMEDPPKKFRRMAPGVEVRLRYAYFVTVTSVVKDDEGNVVELRCSYDPASRGGDSPDGRKVRGTIHWVSAAHAIDAEVRLYATLFTKENPLDVEDGEDFTSSLNAESCEVRAGCKLEPSLAEAAVGAPLQFERLGYFAVDSESRSEALVFNRSVTLRDTWAKIAKRA